MKKYRKKQKQQSYVCMKRKSVENKKKICGECMHKFISVWHAYVKPERTV